MRDVPKADHQGAAIQKAYGRVYLIGAGPGDPELITVKAINALAVCDTVVYDRLCSEEILHYCRTNAELIYVGKLPGAYRFSQTEINRLLVAKALEGRTVARLKGGDPFIFGRGGEEAEALAEAGIPFHVIPGVTSAIAVPAYAGIPLTHRRYASSVGIITGHEDPVKETSHLDWVSLAKGMDTLVFLMGRGNLGNIARQLISRGRQASTPAAVIAWGTTAYQRKVVGTLGDIDVLADREGITHPAIIVIGDVVRLHEKLEWLRQPAASLSPAP